MAFQSFRKRVVGSCATAALLALTAPVAVYAQSASYGFNIPAQDLASALRAYARITRQQVAYGDDIASRRSPALVGSYSADEALTRLLAGSGLGFTRSGSGVILVKAQAPQQDAGAASASEASQVSEVVVTTGSRIRGANPTAPLRVISREEIDRSGFSDVGDLVRSLPEAFGGGQNPGILAAGGSGSNNGSNASTVNLRGLGPEATLVLLNGHRLTGDTFYQGSDISGIPLDALSKVDVLKDGASAIYGSDAIAGVVNFVLRKDFDGTIVKARVGGTTQGGGGEQVYSALTGRTGNRWYALVNVEYARRDAVTAGDRDLTDQMYAGTRLLQPQTQKSAYLSAGLDLTDSLKLSGDALFRDREAGGLTRSGPTSPIYYMPAHTPSHSVSAALEASLPLDWQVKITGTAARSKNDISSYGTIGTSTFTSRYEYRNRNWTFEGVADGTLLRLPGGDLRVAIGGGFRNEDHRETNLLTNGVSSSGKRDISYIFAEALAPLVLPSETRIGLHALDLSISTRYEHYSDFGDTTNPHIGIRYVPFSGITLRGNWGKSFKAPSFIQQYAESAVYLFSASTFGVSQSGTGLMTWGGNPGLKPERSKSWTAGVEYTPQVMQSATLSATYFHIDYKDRIVRPVASYGRATVDPAFVPYVILNPSAAIQQQYINTANAFYNSSGSTYDPANVLLLVQNQYTNALSQIAEGVDFSYRQSFTFPIGEVDTFANATWLTLKQQTTSAAPVGTLTGTLNYAPDFKARAGASWSSGGWGATGTINYLGDSLDNITVPNARIASWTTVDANLEYRFKADRGLASGLKLMLSATNLFDKDPPYVLGAARTNVGQYFDSTNTSPVGRFVAFQVTKGW